MSNNLDIKLKHYQDRFLFSAVRYPAIIGGVGTGKTLVLLLKAWLFCEKYPDSLALVVRREYTDLKDSTIKDFQRYFNVKINESRKEFEFKNKSKIMFRHGDMADINVLKNINLNWIGIEQGEEYESAEIFDFLRDRLRRQTSEMRQMCLIANARGHNWIYDRWIAEADAKCHDEATGQWDYTKGDYSCFTANSFANSDILPVDFIEDLKKMETEAPRHYAQYVMNSFEHVEEDDYLVSQEQLDACKDLGLTHSAGYRIAGVDIARFGKDLCVATIIENAGPYKWREVAVESWNNSDLIYSTGKIMDIRRRYDLSKVVVDGDGLGGGVVDGLKANGVDVTEFRGGMVPTNTEDYINIRSEAYFKLRDMISQQFIQLNNPDIRRELLTIRYGFDNKGKRRIITKDELRKAGIKSPDFADSLMMAISAIKLADLGKSGGRGKIVVAKNNWSVF